MHFPSPIKIAIAQILCLDGDRAGNLLRIENAIAEAKAQDAALVAFPESCLLGWINPAAHERAYPIPGADSDALCALAKKYNVHICIGLDEKQGDQLFGAAILIDKEGIILLKHHKINVLPDLMNPSYSIGNEVSVAETSFGKIGVLICADSFQEELLHRMALQKPDLMLIPYGWAAEENAWPQHGENLVKVVQKVAQTIHCPVVGTNLVGQISQGPWAGRIYGGLSVACDKNGEIIRIGKDREREVAVISVDLKRDFPG